MLQYQEVYGRGLYGPCFMNAHRNLPVDWKAPLIWISPFESLVATVSSLDHGGEWQNFAKGRHSVPRAPGEFAIEYTLVPGSMVKFRVLPVVVEQLAHAQLPSVFFGDRPGTRTELRPEARVAVLRSGERRVVSHGERTDKSRPVVPSTEQATAEEIDHFSPFERLTEIDSAAQLLDVSGLDNAHITVRVNEKNGRRRAFLVDEHRKIVKVDE